ncbi:MAG TPA: tyrosinase family protein [Fimbriimonadaceae bacterium]|nr:tyrosinase family protein [Fimbriimonadaceae bacterium]
MANTIIRKDATQLSDAEVAALRDAYGKMMGIRDNRGWLYWSGIHGYPQYKCWHHGREGFHQEVPYNLFLPWHRAYLLSFEHTVRDQNPDASLPWWDWTTQTGLPDVYVEDVADGNPLQAGPVPAMGNAPERMTERAPGPPSRLPRASRIAQILSLPNFEDLTLQIENVHDGVHGWVGGDMGVVASSAYDPIFFAHHAMIDRIWYLWQLRQGVTNIPPDYLDRTLEPFGLRVRDVLDVNNLGYTYATAAVTVGVGS